MNRVFSRNLIPLTTVFMAIWTVFAGNTLRAQTTGPTTQGSGSKVLEIVRAIWTVSGQPNVDVTQAVAARVENDRLEMLANPVELSLETGTRRGSLSINYRLNGRLRSANFEHGNEIWIAAVSKEEAEFSDKLIELRKQRPRGLLIVSAKFGTGNRWRDVTDLIQDVTHEDSATIPAGTEAFGDPAPGSSGKVLRIAYSPTGNELKVVNQPEGSTLQIGSARTAIVAQGGGLLSLSKRVAELRKSHPSGLIIIDARYGEGNRWFDVTQKLQSMASGANLSVPVGTEAFGDPAPGQGGKNLITTYHDGTNIVTVTNADGSTLKIGSKITSVVAANGQLMNLPDQVEALRKVYGDGLIILDAQYGTGNRWADVRDLLQKSITNGRLNVVVGERWADPAVGSSDKGVKISYWDGKEIQTTQVPAGGKLDLRGVLPDALKAVRAFPAYATEGQPLAHAFGGTGRYALLNGPEGFKLAPDGKVTWTPTAEQRGAQEIRFTVTVADAAYTQITRVEVVSKETARAVATTPGGIATSLRLDLGDASCFYAAGLGNRTALVLTAKELIITGPDGISVRRRGTLTKEYSRIFERDAYFVALAKEPGSLDLLDKATLKPTRSIKLPYRSMTDFALHPTQKMSYVSAEQVGDGPRHRVVIVNEATGDVREPQNVIGTFLAVDSSGRRLYTGYKDTYQKGIQLFINPDGRIWDTPNFGDIDLLMVYDLADSTKPTLRSFKEKAGANGSGIRLSPDGKRLTYLSFTGYPLYSKGIPAWDPNDLQKLPVTYTNNGITEATKMTYHPTQPLVAVPGSSGPLFFNRETGDEEKNRVILPPGVLDGVQVNEVYFSPDGVNAILECQRGGERWLYKVPLNRTTR